MSEVKVDTISERTAANGVVVDGVTIKDSGLTIPSGGTLTVASGGTITNSGTASGFGLFTAYAILREEQTSGTNGQTASGSPAANTWYERVINTEIDPSSIVTVSSNQFTLAAGNYLIEWWGVAEYCYWHQTRLYDVTGSAAVTNGYGSVENDGTSGYTRHSVGHVRVSPTSSNVYSVEHLKTRASGGSFGLQASIGTEVYFECIIYKEA